MKAQRVDTWAVSIADKPGALAAKLKALSAAGVNLEFPSRGGRRRSPARASSLSHPSRARNSAAQPVPQDSKRPGTCIRCGLKVPTSADKARN